MWTITINIDDLQGAIGYSRVDLAKLALFFSVSVDYLLGVTDVTNGVGIEAHLMSELKKAGIVPADREMTPEETEEVAKKVLDAIELIKKIKG